MVLAHVTMMARIEADERLREISDGAIAAGNMRQHDRQRMVRRLEQIARGGVRVRPARATPAALAAMGIGVRVVEARKDGADE